MKIKWNIIIVFLLLFICCAVNDKLYSQSTLQKGKRLTNPLLQYIKFRELKPFRHKVESLLKQQKEKGLVNEVAVYFRSLSDGIWFGINEKEKFSPASLLKVPLMIAYLKIAEKNPEILNKKIKYELLDNALVQNIKSPIDVKIGKYYSVDKLINVMITESDNNARSILTNNIDTNILEKTFEDLGIFIAGVTEKDDFVSLKSYVSLFRILYNAAYLNEAASEKALQYLTRVKYKDGIVASVPSDVVVAHKFGERDLPDTGIRQLHDVGIIYYPNNPYLLGIMTRGKDFDKLSEVIREISKLIYNEVDSQYKKRDKNDFQLSE